MKLFDFKTPKLYFALIVFISVLMPGFSKVTFSGDTGMRLDFYSEKDSSDFDGKLGANAFFAGQLDVGKNVFFRTDLGLKTSTIFTRDVFEGVDASFFLNELSVTFKKSGNYSTSYFSLYLGNFDPVGSDAFLQRMLGCPEISSLVTDNWVKINKACIYPFYGAGAAWNLRFERSPCVLGFYAYYNKKNKEDAPALNLDLRFAGASDFITADLAFGCGFPFVDSSEYEDVVFAMKTVFLHFGWSVLFGNNYSKAALFVQGGLDSYPAKETSKSKFETKDMYLLFEPRFRFKSANLSIGWYNFPEKTLESSLYLKDSSGLNISIFSDSLSVKSTLLTAGCHITMSFPNIYIDELDKIWNSIEDGTFHVMATPFVKAEISKGTLNAMAMIDFSDIIRLKGADCFKISLGYKFHI